MKATNAERAWFRADKLCNKTESYPSILTTANASNPPKALEVLLLSTVS